MLRTNWHNHAPLRKHATAVAVVAAVGAGIFAGGVRGEEDLFAAMDADGSRSLTEHEMRSYFESKNAQLPDDLFATEDANGDGVVSFSEFSGPKRSVRGQGQTQGQGQAGGGAEHDTNVFYRLDFDGNWFISKSEFDALLENETLWAAEDKASRATALVSAPHHSERCSRGATPPFLNAPLFRCLPCRAVP